MTKGNPMTNGTVAQAKKMYAEMGLCYSCGRPLEVCQRELQAEYDDIFPDMERVVLRLMDAITVVYMEIPSPDPQTVPADWPWTDEDYLSELDNHRPEVGF